MEEVRAKLNYLRMSSRKVRQVANLIKGMSVIDAKNNLKFSIKRAAGPLLKLLNSAINNAKAKYNLKEEELFVKRCLVNQGSTLKRWRPRAFGRAALIRKRMSHIEIVLDKIESNSKLKTKQTKKSSFHKTEEKKEEFEKKKTGHKEDKIGEKIKDKKKREKIK